MILQNTVPLAKYNLSGDHLTVEKYTKAIHPVLKNHNKYTKNAANTLIAKYIFTNNEEQI